MEKATFAAGCFWGVEEIFRALPGVTQTKVGYCGGTTKNPTYQEVCTDTTNHAEAIQIEFDPKVITYQQLLDKFWNSHNPTTPNQQGPDIGSQYRSAIFYHSPEQQELAEQSKQDQQQNGKWANRTIVTQIVPEATFYDAEEYHQKYLAKRGLNPSCHI
jgi:peptide-methionine (S)-S-oxide reductase